jgi:hypothetical protein
VIAHAFNEKTLLFASHLKQAGTPARWRRRDVVENVMCQALFICSSESKVPPQTKAATIILPRPASRLFAANVFWEDQSPGLVNGRFYGMKNSRNDTL